MTVSNDKQKLAQDKESCIGVAVEAALAEIPDSMAKHRKKPKGK